MIRRILLPACLVLLLGIPRGSLVAADCTAAAPCTTYLHATRHTLHQASPPDIDETLQLLDDLRERKRSALAHPSIVSGVISR